MLGFLQGDLEKENNFITDESICNYLIPLADSVPVTLLGVGRMEVLKLNLDIVMEGLTMEEMELMEEIKIKFFSEVSGASWENTDIKIYNEAIRN